MEQNTVSIAWPEWQVESELGRGSFGVVYKVSRRDYDITSFAAVKVISIPQNRSEFDSLRSEGLSLNETTDYFKGVVSDCVSEIQLMESFKGMQNIVSVEDYKVIARQDEPGWNILIRMELLEPLNSYLCEHNFDERMTIKLGIDICSALEVCAKRNVIHRDIKPENVFINEFGSFKLGDFGIARKLEATTGSLSRKGTFDYIAPEVAAGAGYDATADIYSLGIMLYRLLNHNRLPFMDSSKQLLNKTDRENANLRRLKGERFELPCDASKEMAYVIMCACNPNPKQRFDSASAMKKALISVFESNYPGENVYNTGAYIPPALTGAAGSPERGQSAAGADPQPADRSRNSIESHIKDKQSGAAAVEQRGASAPAQTKKPKRIGIIIAAAAGALLLLACALILPRLLRRSSTVLLPSGGTNYVLIDQSSNVNINVDGSVFDRGVLLQSSEGEAARVDFDLPRGVTRFSFDVGQTEDSGGADAVIRILLDGTEAHSESTAVRSSDGLRTITIETNGAETVSIITESTAGSSDCGIVNIRTDSEQTAAPAHGSSGQNAVLLLPYDGTFYERYDGSGEETIRIGDTEYSKGAVMHNPTNRISYNGSKLIFDLNGTYSRVEFDIGRVAGTDMNDVTIQILLDGEAISIDGSGNDSLTLTSSVVSRHFSIDTSGVQSFYISMKIIGNGTTDYGVVNFYAYP